MLDAIISWAVKNRLLVVIALIATAVGGTLILPKLNLDAFPDVTNVQVQINTEARGLAAEEVEQLITFPIEATMYSLPDVEEVRSISKTGLSVITVVFTEGTDIYFARQLVFERLQSAREQIPDGIGTPGIGPNTSGLGQVYQYILRADDPEKYDAITLRSYNDWIVKLLLMPVGGVTEVLSFGGEVRQYQVQLNPERLLAYGLTGDDVELAGDAFLAAARAKIRHRQAHRYAIVAVVAPGAVDQVTAAPKADPNQVVVSHVVRRMLRVHEDGRGFAIGKVAACMRRGDEKCRQLGDQGHGCTSSKRQAPVFPGRSMARVSNARNRLRGISSAPRVNKCGEAT